MNPKSIDAFDKIIHTCTITAKSCENPSITFQLSEVPEEKAKRIYRVLRGAFRDIQIISETTGEILLNEYISDKWHGGHCSYGDCIDDAITIYEGK